jgi:lambda family phage tail tape measure protein
MAADGQVLGSIKVAGTLFGDEAAANLQRDSYYFEGITAAMVKIKAEELIKQADVDRAVGMKRELEAAYGVLQARDQKARSDWSNWGIEIQQVWTDIVKDYANALTWLDRILGRTQEITKEAGKPKSPFWSTIGASSFEGFGGDGSDPLTPEQRARVRAEKSLGLQLGNPQNTRNNVNYLQELADKRTPDTSSPSGAGLAGNLDIPKPTGDPNDKVDAAINTLRRHVEAQNADTLAMGLGVGALARFRAEAAQTAAVQANAGQITADQAAKFEVLKKRAEETAVALEKARVAQSISFGRQTALLDPADVAIAQQLKGLYPDVATALNSVEASGLRTNTALSGISSSLSGQLTTGLTDIADGTKSVSQGFGDMSKMVIRAIEEMIIKLTVVQPLMRALQAGFGGGINLSGAGFNPIAGVTGSAYGNAFYGGNVIPFARGGAFSNQIFSDPTFFRFARGGAMANGVMGEAGPEAVMPLRRGPDGKLGIAAAGAGGGAAPNFVFNVSTPPGTTTQQGQFRPDGRGGGSLDIVVKQMVTGAMLDDTQKNGPVSKALMARAQGFSGN